MPLAFTQEDFLVLNCICANYISSRICTFPPRLDTEMEAVLPIHELLRFDCKGRLYEINTNNAICLIALVISYLQLIL